MNSNDKKLSAAEIKQIILNRKQKKAPKQPAQPKNVDNSDDDEEEEATNKSFESSSGAEDLEDYKQDGYHPVYIGENFQNGRYGVIQKLGWGHFSTVWLVHDKKLQTHSALKIQKSKKSYQEAALDELELLRDLQKNETNPQWEEFVTNFNSALEAKQWMGQWGLRKKEVIEGETNQDVDEPQEMCEEGSKFRVRKEETYCINLIDNFAHFGAHGKHYCTVFDIMGPNLLDLIQHFDDYYLQDRYMGKWLVKIITRQILVALIYMHDVCQMIHTDIKPENVMVQLKQSSLGDFIEQMKQYKRKPTSMKFIALKQKSSKNKKNKDKKKKKKQQQQQPQEEVEQEKKQVEELKQDIKEEIKIEKNNKNQEQKAQNEIENSETIQTTIPQQEQIKESEQINVNVEEKQKVKKEDDEDWEDEKSHSSGYDSDSEKVKSVDNETLYTLVWKDHIRIKLDQEIQIKLVDFGNACWTHKHFTNNIQTREYRSPEAILGIEYQVAKILNYKFPYQANTDIWSLACMVFELLTNNFLFKPKKGEGFGKSDDHLALMIETLGKMNKNFALSGSRSKEYINKSGQLINIKDLSIHPISRILIEEYEFSEQDAVEIEDFLLPMLEYDPKKRINAKDALRHPWLWT